MSLSSFNNPTSSVNVSSKQLEELQQIVSSLKQTVEQREKEREEYTKQMDDLVTKLAASNDLQNEREILGSLKEQSASLQQSHRNINSKSKHLQLKTELKETLKSDLQRLKTAFLTKEQELQLSKIKELNPEFRAPSFSSHWMFLTVTLISIFIIGIISGILCGFSFT